MGQRTAQMVVGFGEEGIIQKDLGTRKGWKPETTVCEGLPTEKPSRLELT